MKHLMDKLIKCIWIANTIADTKDQGITLKELNDRWTREDENDPIPERSFHNYRQYIADVFGIDIEFFQRNACIPPVGDGVGNPDAFDEFIHDAFRFSRAKVMNYPIGAIWNGF